MYLQVTYDSTQIFFESQKIHNLITNFKQVLDWWHYLTNVYIIETSTSNEADIADLLRREFPGLRFLVTKIEINTPNGVLPQQAWDWISNKNRQKRSYLKIRKTEQQTMLSFLRVKNTAKPIQNKSVTLSELFKRNTI